MTGMSIHKPQLCSCKKQGTVWLRMFAMSVLYCRSCCQYKIVKQKPSKTPSAQKFRIPSIWERFWESWLVRSGFLCNRTTLVVPFTQLGIMATNLGVAQIWKGIPRVEVSHHGQSAGRCTKMYPKSPEGWPRWPRHRWGTQSQCVPGMQNGTRGICKI